MTLIDLDAVLDILHLDPGIATEQEWMIKELPEAVTRCKDCKHRYEDDCPMRFVEVVQVDDDGYIDHEILYNDNTTDNGYCDSGERRTDEEVEH